MLDRSLSLLTGQVLRYTSRLAFPPQPTGPRCRSSHCSALASAWGLLPASTAPRRFPTATPRSAASDQQYSDPAPLSSLLGSSPTYMRRSLEAMAPWEPFTVAGVSFENRQEAVQEMQVGEPVLLVREPWNPYDDRAVAVYSLRGQSLGFVPRSLNINFQDNELVFGHVEYVGAEPNNMMWGLRVVAQPQLMPAYTSPFPPQLLTPAVTAATMAPAAVAAAKPAAKPRGRKSAKSLQAAVPDPPAPAPAAPAAAVAGVGDSPACWPEVLSAAVGSQCWQQLLADARAKSKGLCEVTGAGAADATLELVPEWQYNEQLSTIKLQGLSLVCREVALARRALDLIPGSPEMETAISTLVAVNGWRNLSTPDMFPEEVYLDYVRQQRQRLLSNAWTLDLSQEVQKH